MVAKDDTKEGTRDGVQDGEVTGRRRKGHSRKGIGRIDRESPM